MLIVVKQMQKREIAFPPSERRKRRAGAEQWTTTERTTRTEGLIESNITGPALAPGDAEADENAARALEGVVVSTNTGIGKSTSADGVA